MKTATEGPVPGSENDALSMDAVCGYCESQCGLQLNSAIAPGDRNSPGGIPSPHLFAGRRFSVPTPRLTLPRKCNLAGEMVPVSWDLALREFTGRLKEIQWRHGKNSVAVLPVGQLALEELASLRQLTVNGLEMLWGGGPQSPALHSTLVNYSRAFGNAAPPYCLNDLEESDVVIFLGMDPVGLHPALWRRVQRNSRSPQLVVIDSRMTETARKSHLFLQVRPGTEKFLLQGLACRLIESGRWDEGWLQRTEGWAEFAQSVSGVTTEEVLVETGIDAAHWEQLVQLLQLQRRVSIWWSISEIEQNSPGVDAAAINLSLILGRPGEPGTGANALLAPCNALGTWLIEQLGDLQAPAQPAAFSAVDIEKRAAPWQRIREEIEQERIKGLWIVGTNASATRIDEILPLELLECLEFLVVQDMHDHAAAMAAADLCLPSVGWGEKSGTLMTSERRLHLIPKVKEPPGQALPDSNIFRLIDRYWGCGTLKEGWETNEAVFQQISEATRGTCWDFSGISYADLKAEPGGIQWPVSAHQASHGQHHRLYEDGTFATPSGRVCFLLDSAELGG